jgi:hypothetical protein
MVNSSSLSTFFLLDFESERQRNRKRNTKNEQFRRTRKKLLRENTKQIKITSIEKELKAK